MRPRAVLPVALAGLSLCALPQGHAGSRLAAQELGVGGGVVYESYAFDAPEATGFESVSLITAPFGAGFEVTSGFEVTLSGAFARGEMSLADGDTREISGLTDTAIRATWTAGRDLVAISGAVYLPTGKVEHTAEEARVAGAIAYDLLPFRISNWGTGGGADGSVAVAVPVGDGVSLGARVGYRMMAEHEPFDATAVGGETFVYDPGDQLYVRAALDANVGTGSKLSVSATWQTFGEDTSEGTNLFRTGDRLQGLASLAFPTVANGSGWVYAGAQHRTEGTFLELEPSADRPSQTLFFGGVGARLRTGGLAFLPVADVRVLRTEDGLGQGFTTSLGGSLEIPLGAGPELVPSGKFRFGNALVSEGVESGFTGFEAGLTVRGVGR